MTAIDYSLALEQAFEKLVGQRFVQKDEFYHHPTKALQDAFSYVYAQGLCSNDDLRMFCAEYDFGKNDLKTILSTELGASYINELLDRLSAMVRT